ncbi:ribosome maturation factor RimM [Nitratireductor mangrovi]|uniref:Ribosome maturation factor RimM n=1 Tax=Nitratireductor mangrovi TaxID=2599600 RepID=A0A5B8KX16_9HYPH|nr:ribosome maturation factor RimM [Nitratireductor mangrovi]QDZ00102.1 ribosome maturation factor RimM [Nitratireductor mangrovi]
MAKPKNPVQVAVIGAAQGIKGGVRVKSFTGDPMALGDYGPLFDREGRRFDILDLRPHNQMVVARFKGVADRNAAEALNGTELFIERERLPEDLEDEEFYHADLVGLDAVDQAGATVGTVRAVLNYGGGDILDLAMPGGGNALVPFTRAAVPSVDLAGRRLMLDRVAAGLDDVDDGEVGEEGDSRGGRKGRGRERRGGFDASDRPRGPKSAGGNR